MAIAVWSKQKVSCMAIAVWLMEQTEGLLHGYSCLAHGANRRSLACAIAVGQWSKQKVSCMVLCLHVCVTDAWTIVAWLTEQAKSLLNVNGHQPIC